MIGRDECGGPRYANQDTAKNDSNTKNDFNIININSTSTKSYLNAYPNPSSSVWILEFHNLSNDNIENIVVSDISGSIINTFVVNSNCTNFSIPCDNFSIGIYFATIYYKIEPKSVVKLIKE